MNMRGSTSKTRTDTTTKKKGNFKRFIKYYKNHKLLFALDIFFVLILTGLSLIFPLIIREIITGVQEGTMTDNKLVTFTIIASAIVIGRMISQFIIGYWGHIMGTNIELDMRIELYNHMQKLPVKYYDQNESGKIVQRLIGDLRDVTEFAHHGPEDILISVLTTIGAFAILFPLHLNLSLFLLAAVAVCMFVLVLSRKRLRNTFKKNKIKQGELSAVITNSIQGIRETKAFANEEYEKKRFEKVAKDFRNSWKNTYFNLATFQSTATGSINATVMSVPIVGAFFLLDGGMDIGSFVAFTLYASYATQPIFKMVQFMEQLQRGMSGIDRFYEVIDSEESEDKGSRELESVRGEIQFKNVSFKYEKDNEFVLKDFDLKIKAGERVALVGPTGVGKTTITSLISRFYPITSGTITLDGIDTKKLTLNNLRSSIGIVQQKPFMFVGSIRENIMYGKLDGTEEEMIEAAKKAHIHSYISKLPKKYDSQVGEQGVKLSGGQKQRIALARIFMSSPEILVLDEATSALDNKTETLVQDALEELINGKTSITVAHRLSTVINSDRIIVLGPKGIVEQGTHKKLLKKKGVYHSLYTSKILETIN